MTGSQSESEQQLYQRELYDRIATAEFPERYRPANWQRSFVKRVFDGVELEANPPYLDVGTGSGVLVIEAARRGVEAVGCDVSQGSVERARAFAAEEGVAERASFIVCAAEKLPFADASFGSASAVAVLEHLDDDRMAIAELARVVRPDGRVWATVPHAYRFIPLPIWPFYWWHDRRLRHRRHYDLAHLRAQFERSGFEFVAAQYTGHPVKVIQYAADRVGLPGSQSWWWALERLDLRAVARRWGALQLSAVFSRAD